MDERQRMEELQDTDFKYVMQDTGNIYIGARLTYAEMCIRDRDYPAGIPS